MKKLAVLLAVMIPITAAATWLTARQPSGPGVAMCPHCAQDMANAVYTAWNQLDCDDADTTMNATGTSCNDELNDVNRRPLVNLAVAADGTVTVKVQVFTTGGPGTINYIAVYDANGAMRSFH